LCSLFEHKAIYMFINITHLILKFKTYKSMFILFTLTTFIINLKYMNKGTEDNCHTTIIDFILALINLFYIALYHISSFL